MSGFQITAKKGWTDKFIYPPYKFKMADRLITNFHQPQSTLMMLVSAFADKEFIMDAYSEAIKKKYSFYSYGDAMMIIIIIMTNRIPWIYVYKTKGKQWGTERWCLLYV